MKLGHSVDVKHLQTRNCNKRQNVTGLLKTVFLLRLDRAVAVKMKFHMEGPGLGSLLCV